MERLEPVGPAAVGVVLGALVIEGPPGADLAADVERCDPAELVTIAEREGLAGLLRANLERTRQLERLPRPQRTLLDQRYRRTAALNLRKMAATRALLARFERTETPAVVLKGLAMLESLYAADPGVRPTGDIDLRIDAGERPAAIGALAAEGFDMVPLYPDTWANGSTFVDLHNHLLGSERIRARAHILAAGEQPLLDGSRPTSYGPAPATRLGPAQEILLACLHLLKHNADRLLWLIEINELAARLDESDWRYLLQLAEECGHQRSLDRVAFLARRLLREHATDRFAELDPHRLGGIDRRVLARRSVASALPVWATLVYYAPQHGIRRRLVSIFETLFPRPEILRQVFGDARASVPTLYARRLAQLVSLVFR